LSDGKPGLEEREKIRRGAEDSPDRPAGWQKRWISAQWTAGRGSGDWFGGFLGGKPAADLGIFHSGRVGCCQSVQTLPDFRHRGMAGTLVYAASAYALDRYGLDRLVIVAGTESAAGWLYQSLGFKVTEHQAGLQKRPADQREDEGSMARHCGEGRKRVFP
jgi:GNAT superfamily N-acetyltransferase